MYFYVLSSVQFIKLEHVRLEYISIQLATDAPTPKPSAKIKAFQNRFTILNARFLNKQIDTKEILAGLSLLIEKNNVLFVNYYFVSCRLNVNKQKDLLPIKENLL